MRSSGLPALESGQTSADLLPITWQAFLPYVRCPAPRSRSGRLTTVRFDAGRESQGVQPRHQVCVLLPLWRLGRPQLRVHLLQRLPFRLQVRLGVVVRRVQVAWPSQLLITVTSTPPRRDEQQSCGGKHGRDSFARESRRCSSRGLDILPEANRTPEAVSGAPYRFTKIGCSACRG